MNLIYLHTHDTGRCYQPYGYPVVTPGIMRLAAQSLQFNQAFCCAPTCSPSRSAMLTGVTPHNCGMLGLAHRGFALSDPSRHLAAWLGAHGYETVLCGVQHEAKSARDLPYQRLLKSASGLDSHQQCEAYDLYNAGQAESFLREMHEKPFFLSFGLRCTHRPYPAHPGDGAHIAPPHSVPSTPETRADAADFAASIDVVDRCVARVLDVLQDTGLAEDTVILFTTDHGPAFPNYKCTLLDGGIGVTLMLSVPGMARRGQVTDCLTSHLDVFPTVCDLLGVEKPAWLQGVSLLPVLAQDQPVRERVFAEVTYHAAYEPLRCVRTARYKLIRRYDTHNRVVPANIDASPSKQAMVAAGLLEAARPREELYDLLLDPGEHENRVNDPALRDVYAALSAALTDWMRDTDDPLLTCGSRVPKPAGARVNTLSAPEPDSDYWEE